jgi:hypothetical protein
MVTGLLANKTYPMATKNLDHEIEQLNEKTKLVDTYEFAERAKLQKELDSIASEGGERSAGKKYLLFEAQARLHLIASNYEEADKFCREAMNLNGAEYADAKFLSNRISAEQNKAQALEREISSLRSQNGKYGGLLTLAAISLIIFVPLYLSANSLSNRESEMIDTCSAEIAGISSTLSDANDAISSMNDSLDTISNDASDSAGSDYDTQAETLDDISSNASDAQGTTDFSAPTTLCEQVNTDTSS